LQKEEGKFKGGQKRRLIALVVKKKEGEKKEGSFPLCRRRIKEEGRAEDQVEKRGKRGGGKKENQWA